MQKCMLTAMPTAMLNAAKLTAAMHNLKNDFDTNQIDAMTYVKLVSLNLMSAKRKRYIKRCSSIIKSIKQKYARKVTNIICRLGKQRLLPWRWYNLLFSFKSFFLWCFISIEWPSIFWYPDNNLLTYDYFPTRTILFFPCIYTMNKIDVTCNIYSK